MQSLSSLNKEYTRCLQAKPLSTKALTLVFFALLNEQLASFFAGDIQKLKISRSVYIPHTMTTKVPLMGLFALLVNAPLTHYGYRLIQKLVPSPLTPRKKIYQILLSIGIITPIATASFVSWIGLINNLNAFKKELKNGTNFKKLVRLFLNIVRTSLKASFIKVFSTSAITSPIFMLLAQKFIIPEAWAVFFAFCYFIVGTYNNTKVKLLKKRLENEKKKRLEQETEDNGPKSD